MIIENVPAVSTNASLGHVLSLTGKRIAVLSYPVLFQVPAGMAMKVRRTVQALTSIGVDARLVNPVEDRLADYDLAHVFGAFNSNDRTATFCKALGKPVVISPILMPPFSPAQARLAHVIDLVVGRLTRWRFNTTYGQIRRGLDAADTLLALGAAEQAILAKCYGQPASKVRIVPNGVGEAFYTASPDLFLRAVPLSRPMVLHVGIVGETKNQLG